VKTEALLRHLRKNGCYLRREGKEHSLWTNLITGKTQAVPRHIEIGDRLAVKICRYLGVPPVK